MTAVTVPPKRPLRNAGFSYTAVMAVMVVILLIALIAAPSSAPPAIAEIAPQAVEQIQDAPPEQATKFGRGADGEGEGDPGGDGPGGGGGPPPPGATTSTVLAQDAPKQIPSIRRCIGDPPRQIEDPQSPPCVPFFQGDNGGATWKGVTGDTIRVAVPGGGSANFQSLTDFFNRRFEFYGRKLVMVDTPAAAGGDAQLQVTAAVAADEQFHVFASLPPGAAAVEYTDELARRQIINVTNRPTFTTEKMADKRPYIWSYTMAQDRIFAALGEWACNRLIPGKARWAGQNQDKDMRQDDRKFGLILYSESAKEPVDPGPLERELKACGSKISAVYDAGANFTFGDWSVAAVSRMQQAGVTSIFCLCNSTPWGAVASAASSQLYFPEWMVSSYILTDSNFFIRPYVPAEQREHSMGITQQPRQLPFCREPAGWAFLEQSPGFACENTDSSTAYGINTLYYRPLLLLAAGVQMAGPRLTPQTFERGLQMAKFPNPEHPNRPGKVGFQGGSHAMTIDSAEAWWDNEGTGPAKDDTGAWCYVDDGERRKTGTWKKGDSVFFQPPCRTGKDE